MNHYVFLGLQPWKHLVLLNRVPGRTRGPDFLPSQLPALFPWLPPFFPLALLEDLSSTTLPKLPFSAPSRPHDSIHGPTCQGRKTKITRTVLTFAELSCEAAITLDSVLVQYIRFYELSLLANEEPISILQNKEQRVYFNSYVNCMTTRRWFEGLEGTLLAPSHSSERRGIV